jgi:hypothetical protein
VAEAGAKVDEKSAEAKALPPGEVRSRVITLLAIFGISLVFWIAFYQIFYTFTFWARDSTATRWNPETFQVFEPLGVILLSPVLVATWAWLQRRNAEPSTPVKMLLGVLLVAAAFGALSYAGSIGGDTGRVSPLWLIAANVLIALGEISLSPMGMSLVNRLSPPQFRGLMMGVCQPRNWRFSLGANRRLLGPHAAQSVLPDGRRHPGHRRHPAQPADAPDQADDVTRGSVIMYEATEAQRTQSPALRKRLLAQRILCVRSLCAPCLCGYVVIAIAPSRRAAPRAD